MLKKLFCVVLCFSFVGAFFSFKAESAGISVSAESAIVMNARTGEVFFSKNAYEKRGIASTTKIMTSLIALEQGDLLEVTTATGNDVTVEGTSIGLKSGDDVTLGVLVKGMLLESGNDAANVTATVIAGSKEKFAVLMNNKAKELGMNSTNFVNPSGLTEDGHYSTAYDMALLASEAIMNKTFRDICSADSLKVTYGTPEYTRTFYNHNKFLDMFDGAIGIKTGFTKASGRCLVTAAERDGVVLVGVTLKAPDDWNDHVRMMNYAFENLKVREVEFNPEEYTVPVVGAEKKSVGVELVSELSFATMGGITECKTVVYLPPFLYSDVLKGDFVGRVDIVDERGRVIASSWLIATQNIPTKVLEKEENTSFFQKIINKIKEGLS